VLDDGYLAMLSSSTPNSKYIEFILGYIADELFVIYLMFQQRASFGSVYVTTYRTNEGIRQGIDPIRSLSRYDSLVCSPEKSGNERHILAEGRRCAVASIIEQMFNLSSIG